MRIAVAVGVASILCACVGQQVDLGGHMDGGGGTQVSSTMAVVTCAGGASDMAATLGDGFNALRPAACTAPRGPTHTVSSATDVVALLAGVWDACSGSVFGVDQGLGWSGVQLTSDGHYFGLTRVDDGSLVPVDSAGNGSSSGSGSGSPAPSSNPDGTFTVVDGTATYGPGTYQLQLRPASGGLFEGQVLVTDSPTQIHFFPTNASEDVLALALPWSPRKGVCSCVSATGTVVDRNDPVGLASALTGRWMWCGGTGGLPVGYEAMGIEFRSDGTWDSFEEDTNGTLTPGMGGGDGGIADHGTFQFVPTGPPNSATGPEPLTLTLDQGSQGTLTQVVVTENPRILFFADGTMGTNGPGGPMVSNIYSILFPMP